jgi:preprotein translocase subunit SecG
MGAVFAIVLSLLAIFLILLVLVQRGRGGGLAGALGGMGGSSAFGAKAGDVFTRITIIVASIWIAFCLLALFWSKHRGDVLGTNTPISSSSSDLPKTMPPLTAPANNTGGTKDAATGAAMPPATPPAATTAAPPAEAPAATTAPVTSESPAAPAGDAASKEAPAEK